MNRVPNTAPLPVSFPKMVFLWEALLIRRRPWTSLIFPGKCSCCCSVDCIRMYTSPTRAKGKLACIHVGLDMDGESKKKKFQKFLKIMPHCAHVRAPCVRNRARFLRSPKPRRIRKNQESFLDAHASLNNFLSKQPMECRVLLSDPRDNGLERMSFLPYVTSSYAARVLAGIASPRPWINRCSVRDWRIQRELRFELDPTNRVGPACPSNIRDYRHGIHMVSNKFQAKSLALWMQPARKIPHMLFYFWIRGRLLLIFVIFPKIIHDIASYPFLTLQQAMLCWKTVWISEFSGGLDDPWGCLGLSWRGYPLAISLRSGWIFRRNSAPSLATSVRRDFFAWTVGWAFRRLRETGTGSASLKHLALVLRFPRPIEGLKDLKMRIDLTKDTDLLQVNESAAKMITVNTWRQTKRSTPLGAKSMNFMTTAEDVSLIIRKRTFTKELTMLSK